MSPTACSYAVGISNVWFSEFVSIFEIGDDPLVVPAGFYRLTVTEGDFVKIFRVNRMKLEEWIRFSVPPVDEVSLMQIADLSHFSMGKLA